MYLKDGKAGDSPENAKIIVNTKKNKKFTPIYRKL